jgi:hypothetical protein
MRNNSMINSNQELQFYKYTNRLISKLSINGQSKKQYGFYQSTGDNSAFKNTWFPFSGMRLSWFIKPHEGLYLSDSEKFFDQHFVNFIRNGKNIFKVQELPPGWVQANEAEMFMIRFGNTECMLISYLIGGGYWECPESLMVRKYINQYYSYELNRLKISAGKTIEDFQKPQNITQLQNDPENEAQSAETINSFLTTQFGAEQVKIDDYTQRAFDDYSIATEVKDKVSKLKIIRYLCKEYQQYLLAMDSSQDKILEDKKDVMNELCTFLDNHSNEPSTLDAFGSVFLKQKHILMQRRDSIAMLFVKSILTLLTFGLVAYFGIWSVKGEKLQHHLDKLLDPQYQPNDLDIKPVLKFV